MGNQRKKEGGTMGGAGGGQEGTGTLEEALGHLPVGR